MKDPGVSFHRLPSSPERKRQWLAAFDVSEEEWCTHWRVCSRHFPDGNPKAAPHSYLDDQFATMWSLRKRAKLDGSRTGAQTRHHQATKPNNSILALRATHGALSHPFPVINTTTTAPGAVTTISYGEGEPRTVHARAPPVLLPVASLPANHHLVGGPITVITRENLTQHGAAVAAPGCGGKNQPLHGHRVGPGGVHVHELVVMPEVAPPINDETSSESSENDESPMMEAVSEGERGLGGRNIENEHLGPVRIELATTNNARVSPSNEVHTPEAMSGGVINHQMLSPSNASLSRINHIASAATHATCLSGETTTTTSTTTAAMDGIGLARTGDGASRDLSVVVVQRALLAQVAALENDNRHLRQKVASSSSSSSSSTHVLCVQVTDSTTGRQAEGIPVELCIWQNLSSEWTLLNSGVTDEMGECLCLLSQTQLSPGLYRLHFDTQSYFNSQGHSHPHYPYVEVVFRVYKAKSCHRVSLQLSPFSYTTSSHSN